MSDTHKFEVSYNIEVSGNSVSREEIRLIQTHLGDILRQMLREE